MLDPGGPGRRDGVEEVAESARAPARLSGLCCCSTDSAASAFDVVCAIGEASKLPSLDLDEDDGAGLAGLAFAAAAMFFLRLSALVLTRLLLSALFLVEPGGVCVCICVCVSDVELAVAVAVEVEVAADTTEPALLMRRIGLRLLWPCNINAASAAGPLRYHRSQMGSRCTSRCLSGATRAASSWKATARWTAMDRGCVSCSWSATSSQILIWICSSCCCYCPCCPSVSVRSSLLLEELQRRLMDDVGAGQGAGKGRRSA